MSEHQATIGGQSRRNILMRYIERFDDGEMARCAFYGLLAGAIAVIGLDLKTLYDDRLMLDPDLTGGTVIVVPALRPGSAGQPALDPREDVTVDDDALRRPLRFELRPNGVMVAQGSIDAGAADRFAAEMDARGEYVKTLSLNSPGGSLDDAMAMARLAREREIATEVADGALCASSCPLVLAGGVVRNVSDKAAVGLHQFYATAEETRDPAQAMSEAQATAARIARYLAEMGVDPALWLHAFDTPPQALYYLSPDEMVRYRLVTAGPSVASR